MELKRVPRTRLVDSVVEALRAAIAQRNLSSGDRLPSEPELTRQLGISRPILREALGRLQSMGMVTAEHGRGTFVADADAVRGCVQLMRTALSISSADLIRFVELRAAIECYAVRRVAEVASEEQIGELQRLCRVMDVAGLDYAEYLERDLTFHLKIVEYAGNPLSLNVMEIVKELVVEAWTRTVPAPQERRWAEGLHTAIVDAIRSRNPDAAEVAVRHHMEQLCHRLRQAGAADEGVVKAG